MARQRLTEASIRSLQTSKAQEDLFHTPTPSAGLRLTRDGRKTWFVTYRSPTVRDASGRGKLRRLSLGEHPSGKRGQGIYLSLKDFEAAYDIIRGDLRRGIDPADSGVILPGESDTLSMRRRTPAAPVVSPPEHLAGLFPEVRQGSLGHLLLLWLDAAREGRGCKPLAPRTILNYSSAARTHLQALAKLPASEVTSDMCEDLFQTLAGRSPQMVRFIKKIISGAYQHAKAHVRAYRQLSNPTQGIKVNVPKGRRERWLSDSEVKTLLSSLPLLSDPLARDVYTLILASGCRPGEAAGIRAEDVLKLNGERVWKVRYKTDRDHLIPLIGPIGEIITRRMLAVSGSGPLFWEIDRTAEYPSQLRAANKELRALTGLDDIRPHDLRRTMRTHLEILGVTHAVGEILLNHQKEGIVQTYSLYDYWKERKTALSLWHQRLAELEGESSEAYTQHAA